MASHPYLYEKLISTRYAQIEHDMRQSQVQTHPGQQQTLIRSTMNGLGTALIEIGSQLQRTGQRRGASVRSS